MLEVKNMSGGWRRRRVRNWGFGRFLSSSLKALVSSRYIPLVICRPEGAWVMGLPVCYDGVDRGKKGVIVLQPSLRVGDVQGWLEDDDPFFTTIDTIVADRETHHPRALRPADH